MEAFAREGEGELLRRSDGRLARLGGLETPRMERVPLEDLIDLRDQGSSWSSSASSARRASSSGVIMVQPLRNPLSFNSGGISSGSSFHRRCGAGESAGFAAASLLMFAL